MKKPKNTVIMPAYNARETLEKTISDIPFDFVDEIILVDDASHDGTADLAKEIASNHSKLTPYSKNGKYPEDRIPFIVVSLDSNKGYGGNQKHCYDLALERGADTVIMVHPDYQYDPKCVKHFVQLIGDGYFDVMIGSRIRSRKESLAGGMPLYKYVANRVLSFIQNVASGRNLSEWHSGMRAYKRQVLESVDYESFSNDFIFDTQMLFAVVENNFSIGDIPVPVRYFKEASSINFSRSAKYGVLTLWQTFLFIKNRYIHSSK